MSSRKLHLSDLKVQSFVTALADEDLRAVQGGSAAGPCNSNTCIAQSIKQGCTIQPVSAPQHDCGSDNNNSCNDWCAGTNKPITVIVSLGVAVTGEIASARLGTPACDTMVKTTFKTGAGVCTAAALR